MNIIFFLLILTTVACTPKRNPEIIVEEAATPSVVISGHYSETLSNDSETMRRAAEIQSVIAKEKERCN